MATNIKADYEKILEIQEQMKQTKEKLVEKMNDTKQAIDKLDNGDIWRGAGFESYRDKMEAFRAIFNAFTLDLTTMTKNLDEVVEKYKKVDKEAMAKVQGGA